MKTFDDDSPVFEVTLSGQQIEVIQQTIVSSTYKGNTVRLVASVLDSLLEAMEEPAEDKEDA